MGPSCSIKESISLATPQAITLVTVSPRVYKRSDTILMTCLDGAANDLRWNYSAPYIFSKTREYTDIVFSTAEGDSHWVITPNLAGAYQYFVNRAVPVLGEFRCEPSQNPERTLLTTSGRFGVWRMTLSLMVIPVSEMKPFRH